MIYTARQVEELWKANGSNGQVVLPYRARLSPLATDWIKQRKVQVGYSDGAVAEAAANKAKADATHRGLLAASGGEALPFLWWCDGPCGTAKAALMQQARESTLTELALPADAGKIIPAIKGVAAEVKAGRAAGAIFVVSAGSAALVYANRCPSLRAIVGTGLDSVEQGIRQVAANVLIVEHPQKTLQQIKNLLGRFVKAKRDVSDEMTKAFSELASCG